MDSKTIKKYADKDYDSLHATAKRWFHKYIRLRDTDEYGYGTCISSGQPLKYGHPDCQAGHLFAAGNHRLLEFNEDNVNLQGKSDNFYGHGNESVYMINLEKKIGKERVEKLKQLEQLGKRITSKNDRYLMIDIIEKYKIKVKEIAKTKMFEVK